MTSGKVGDDWCRGEVLINLRYGIRQAARLAEQLSGDALIGHEVRALLGRLQAIRTELDLQSAVDADQRMADNDPFWNAISPPAHHHNGASQAGM